jgi:4-hydroxybenzoate polyprenyltransferase
MPRAAYSRLCDYLFFLRPLLLVPVWTIFLLGYEKAPGKLVGFDPHLWIGLLALSTAFGGAFVLNQYFDVATDSRNRKCPFLHSGTIGRQAALAYYGALTLTSLGCLAWIPASAPYLLGVLVLGVLYSVPPWRWKDRPWLGLAANACAHGLLVFGLARAVSAGRLTDSLWAALPYVAGVAAVYLLTTIPDLEGDRLSGKRTLAQVLGPERAARWALGWYLSASLLAVYVVDPLFLISVLPSFPFFVLAGRGDLVRAGLAVRTDVGGLSCAAALRHTWYAVVLLLGFWATRVYYRKRWGCRYP